MDFTNTRLVWNRPITSYSKIQWIISSIIRNRPYFINQAGLRDKEYLDIGCGPNIHRNFINLDYDWRPGIDICWDVSRRLPLADVSLKGVFTEHCLEHLSI